ncbi:MAG: hypothetical protein ACRD2T_05325 [Thermoanaerobaculia bacterium]
MDMRTRWILLSSVLALVAGPLSAQVTTGAARLHQIDQSRIGADVTFVDTGDTLIVQGSAAGLDPTKAYISLLYDRGSKPSGPEPCEPTDDSLSGPQMFVWAWTVEADGTGTIMAVKTGDGYAPLAAVGTMSIRVGPAFGVQACGRVHEDD